MVVKEGPELGLGTFRFDPQAYAHEIAQAIDRVNHMWPARSVAEKLQAIVLPGAYRQGQDYGSWIRGYPAIRAPEERPDVVEISYYARDQTGQRYAMHETAIRSPTRSTTLNPTEDKSCRSCDPTTDVRQSAAR
ncbi:hypothetical protein [Krasilnikovia sp. MM14-A1259]|uniref:hypothetical protein n=1 Tax=Krasilnikovia sp. MM14-A1259 TaxID=3373539 RepID=UPI00399C866E